MYTAIKINKTFPTHLEGVVKFFSILFILNDISLSKGEILFLAFACVYGDIADAKEEFAATTGLSQRFFENSCYKLLKRGFLYKEGKKLLLSKQLHKEFDVLVLKIQIDAEKA